MHPEVMTRSQRVALARLGPGMHARGSYLGGGTAIALHLGHRRSVDLDWFSPAALGDPMVVAVQLEQAGVPYVIQALAHGSLHGMVGRTRVSVLEYRFPLVDPLAVWPEYGCELAGLDDLAAMKLSAVAQGGAKRDFIDIYALAVAHRPLPDLLEVYRRKYGIDNIVHVLYGLTYSEDADSQRMPRMVWSADWRLIKRSISTWVRALA